MFKADFIKICGLSTPDTVDAVIDGGATHMGMIFFEKSPRHVSLNKAAELSARANTKISKVAVTVNADDTYLDEIVRHANPDILQLHGSETIDRVKALKEKFGLPIIKVFSVREKADLDAAKAYIGIADQIMFDAKAPEGSEIPGGNGVAFDWDIMDHWPKDVPYILSGGLNGSNIEEALSRSGTKSIDVSSGVEIRPGEKDRTLITQFLSQLA